MSERQRQRKKILKPLKELYSSQKGQALAMALVLLMFGGFLVLPLLDLMNGNMRYSRTIEDYDKRYYAADAGIQYALWAVHDDPSMVPPEQPSEEATISLDFPDVDKTMNGVAEVEVTITNMGNRIYRIVSTAIDPYGRQTRIQSDVYFLNFSHLAIGAITSDCGVKVNNTTIEGDIYYCDECGEANINNSTCNNSTCNPTPKCQTNWPTAAEMKDYYDDYVDKNNPFPYALIDAKDYASTGIGPLYRNGDLTIKNTECNPTLNLNGTIYVTGNFATGQSGSKNYTINLNGETIFVEGSINFAGGVTLIGSGCIIAVGDINFQPNLATSSNDFIFVMSIEGTTNFQPNGNFYGALVGDASVEVKNGTIIWTDPTGKGLDFPGLGDDDTSSSGRPQVRTYLTTNSTNQ